MSIECVSAVPRTSVPWLPLLLCVLKIALGARMPGALYRFPWTQQGARAWLVLLCAAGLCLVRVPMQNGWRAAAARPLARRGMARRRGPLPALTWSA